jgi:MscS family membrane protein
VSHPQVEVDSVRVQFFRLGTSSLDIEVFAYFAAAGWWEFRAVQQELLLRMMEVVEQSGTEIALPTQTVHVRDAGLPAAALSTSGARGSVTRGRLPLDLSTPEGPPQR